MVCLKKAVCSAVTLTQLQPLTSAAAAAPPANPGRKDALLQEQEGVNRVQWNIITFLCLCLLTSLASQAVKDPSFMANLAAPFPAAATNNIVPFWMPSPVNTLAATAPVSSPSSHSQWAAGPTCRSCGTGSSISNNPLLLLTADATTSSITSSTRCLQQLLGKLWQQTAQQPIAAALHSLTTASVGLGLTAELQDKLAAFAADKAAQAQQWQQELAELLDPTPQPAVDVMPPATNTKLWVQQAYSSAGQAWLHSSKVVQQPLAALATTLSDSAQQRPQSRTSQQHRQHS